MAAVRTEEEAFADDRYDDLAARAGLADADHARGKMLRVWRQCTIEGTHFVSRDFLARVFPIGGADALIGARLGELQEDDSVRVRGAKGRVEWLTKLRANGRKGGRPKRLPAKPNGSHLVTNSITKTEPAQEKEKEQEQESLPDRAATPPPVSVPVPSGDQGAASVERVQAAVRPSPVVQSAVAAFVTRATDRAGIRSAGATVPPAPLDPAAALRRTLVDSFPDRVNRARTRVATSLRLTDVRPIPLMGRESELLERLKTSSDPVADFDHVLKVAETEARRTTELRWLSWSMVEKKSWESHLATTVAEAKSGPRSGKPVQPSAPPSEKFAPVVDPVLTDAERFEISQSLQALAKDPTGGKKS